MGKVIQLDTMTYLDLPPDRILESAKEKLSGVVVLGWVDNEQEDLYFASSIADGADVLWLLEKCKQQLMNFDGGDT